MRLDRSVGLRAKSHVGKEREGGKATLKRWTMPSHYFGATWEEYYLAGFGRSRDSDCLEENNFVEALAALGDESETVIVARVGLWAVGWVEWIAVNESDEKGARLISAPRKALT
jgi:hypothetical protein